MYRTLAAALVIAAVGILWPAQSFAQIEEVTIGVKGLTCNLCAAGLERSLRRVDGVSGVQIEIADEAVTVRLKAGSSFDPDRFRAAVKNAGQEARSFELRLNAAVQRQDGRYSLQPGAGAQPMLVRPPSAARLEPYVGKIVSARAKLLSSARSPVELEVTEVALR